MMFHFIFTIVLLRKAPFQESKGSGKVELVATALAIARRPIRY